MYALRCSETLEKLNIDDNFQYLLAVVNNLLSSDPPHLDLRQTGGKESVFMQSVYDFTIVSSQPEVELLWQGILETRPMVLILASFLSFIIIIFIIITQDQGATSIVIKSLFNFFLKILRDFKLLRMCHVYRFKVNYSQVPRLESVLRNSLIHLDSIAKNQVCF
eukprot:TRINITY_DN516_c0_g1_i11.p9 TRINITY_DN516_c0_g1~~TRINITY_DN516_c0_g1_i11.p9  ORF type:complete len:164 (+),score=1.34 TRINITY_DN516_c0_g1_i11:544-1035(+)